MYTLLCSFSNNQQVTSRKILRCSLSTHHKLCSVTGVPRASGSFNYLLMQDSPYEQKRNGKKSLWPVCQDLPESNHLYSSSLNNSVPTLGSHSFHASIGNLFSIFQLFYYSTCFLIMPHPCAFLLLSQDYIACNPLPSPLST